MRLRLEETPALQREAEQAHHDAEEAVAAGGEDPVGEARQSGKGRLKEIFTRHREAVLICMGLVLLYNVTNYVGLPGENLGSLGGAGSAWGESAE